MDTPAIAESKATPTWLWLCLALAALVVVGLMLFATPAKGVTKTELTESQVKIVLADGHGSGVHIGNGYIITAAHVVAGRSVAEIRTPDGRTFTGMVKWANEKADIALLKVEGDFGHGAAPLSCRVPGVGEMLTAQGSPIDLEFATLTGRVAGKAKPLGPWGLVVPIQMPVAPGNSGGPVFDGSGQVVGIVTGVMVFPIGYGATIVGIGYFVPGSVICDLMARTA